MDKIIFENLPSEETAVSAENLNLMQSNIEKSVVAVNLTEPTTNEKVWIKKGKNLSRINSFSSVNTSQEMFTSRIEVNANTNYTISLKKTRIEGVNITNNALYGVAHIKLYNNAGGLLSDISGQTYNFSSGSKDIQENVLTPTNSAYMIIDFGNNNGDSNFNTSVSNIQVEQGSEATSFESHVEKEILVKNDNGVFEKLINAENSDTGWISMTQYINDTYFAARPGYEPKARRIGNVVYWKGEVYCKTAVGSQIADVLIGIPVIFRPDYQVSVAGCPYKGDTEAYNMFLTGIGNITVSKSENIVATGDIYGFQLGNLSGYLVD